MIIRRQTTRRARGTGRRRAWRDRYQQDVHRLCLWAKNREGLAKPPSHEKALGSKWRSDSCETTHLDLIDWNAVALELIETTLLPVYGTPRLTRGVGRRKTECRIDPDAERRRREGTRELHEELSRYFLLGEGQATWSCPELTMEGKHGCDPSTSSHSTHPYFSSVD